RVPRLGQGSRRSKRPAAGSQVDGDARIEVEAGADRVESAVPIQVADRDVVRVVEGGVKGGRSQPVSPVQRRGEVAVADAPGEKVREAVSIDVSGAHEPTAMRTEGIDGTEIVGRAQPKLAGSIPQEVIHTGEEVGRVAVIADPWSDQVRAPIEIRVPGPYLEAGLLERAERSRPAESGPVTQEHIHPAVQRQGLRVFPEREVRDSIPIEVTRADVGVRPVRDENPLVRVPSSRATTQERRGAGRPGHGQVEN